MIVVNAMIIAITVVSATIIVMIIAITVVNAV